MRRSLELNVNERETSATMLTPSHTEHEKRTAAGEEGMRGQDNSTGGVKRRSLGPRNPVNIHEEGGRGRKTQKNAESAQDRPPIIQGRVIEGGNHQIGASNSGITEKGSVIETLEREIS